MRVVLEFEPTGLMKIRCVCRSAADQLQAARALVVIAPVVEELAADQDPQQLSKVTELQAWEPNGVK